MGLQLPDRVRRLSGWAVTAPALVLLTACSEQDKGDWKRGAMPQGASDRSGAIIEFWQWTWIAALIVGVFVWGLIFYAIFKFRRRSDTEIPVQTRYNLPIEILYTVAPIIIVLVFFKYVVDTQNAVNQTEDKPQHVINVVGQKWAWSFNYVEDEALDGTTTVHVVGNPAEPPTLVLPVDETVRFDLNSPDVIHSFWVPAFNYKLDVIPGKTNAFSITPTRTGTFKGKCAELCGAYHSRMLFSVKIVEPDEYAAYLKKLSSNPDNVGLFKGGDYSQTQVGLEDAQTGASE